MTLTIKRGYARNYKGAPIIFSNFGDDRYNNALMQNFSVGGMHFVSNSAIRPGSNISIEVITQSPNGKIAGPIKWNYKAKVVWCKQMPGESGYGVGVRFYKTMEQYSSAIRRKEK